MSLLSHDELVTLVNAGVVENCPLELVNGASIDVTLGDIILRERPVPGFRDGTGYYLVDFSKRDPLHMETYNMNTGRGDRNSEGQPGEYRLYPGEFILASSQQVFNLPNDIAAEYKLKSSMARIGLNHLNAGWCDPTWHGSVLTLELVNTTRRHSIVLHAGDRIGQIVFFRCAPVKSSVSYAEKGRYNRDTTVRGIKP